MVSLSGSLQDYDTALLDHKDITWYLERCGGVDFYEFNSHDEAYDFGLAIRDFEMEVDVEINYRTVRLYLPDYEPKE